MVALAGVGVAGVGVAARCTAVDSTVPVDEPGGHAAVSVPQRSHTWGMPKPATQTRPDPSMASDHGSVPCGSLYIPAMVPSGRIWVTVL